MTLHVFRVCPSCGLRSPVLAYHQPHLHPPTPISYVLVPIHTRDRAFLLPSYKYALLHVPLSRAQAPYRILCFLPPAWLFNTGERYCSPCGLSERLPPPTLLTPVLPISSLRVPAGLVSLLLL